MIPEVQDQQVRMVIQITYTKSQFYGTNSNYLTGSRKTSSFVHKLSVAPTIAVPMTVRIKMILLLPLLHLLSSYDIAITALDDIRI